MEHKKEKLPYQPPVITKVVLKKEQAILSQCSAARRNNSASGTKCIASGCRRATSGTVDNTIVS